MNKYWALGAIKVKFTVGFGEAAIEAETPEEAKEIAIDTILTRLKEGDISVKHDDIQIYGIEIKR